MINIFYIPLKTYVPSNHPLLFDYLKANKEEDIKLVNINDYSPNEISAIINESSLLILDHSLIEALRISREGWKPSQQYLYFNFIKTFDFYKQVICNLVESAKKIFYFASTIDLHSIYMELGKLKPIGIEPGSFLTRISGIIYNFTIENQLYNTCVNEAYKDSLSMNGKDTVGEMKQQIIQVCNTLKGTLDFEMELLHSVLPGKLIQKTKKWDIVIPGIPYITRKIAEERILASALQYSLLRKNQYFFGKLNGFLYKTQLLKPPSVWKINYNIMEYYVQRSKFTFVCGGPIKYFVRKFIEIPVMGSVMLAYPPDNMQDYGFTDMYNFISVTPEQTAEVAQKYKNDVELQNFIIKNAFNTVQQMHTVSVRAAQLIKALRLYRDKNISKAYFKNGEFIYTGADNDIIDTYNSKV